MRRVAVGLIGPQCVAGTPRGGLAKHRAHSLDLDCVGRISISVNFRLCSQRACAFVCESNAVLGYTVVHTHASDSVNLIRAEKKKTARAHTPQCVGAAVAAEGDWLCGPAMDPSGPLVGDSAVPVAELPPPVMLFSPGEDGDDGVLQTGEGDGAVRVRSSSLPPAASAGAVGGAPFIRGWSALDDEPVAAAHSVGSLSHAGAIGGGLARSEAGSSASTAPAVVVHQEVQRGASTAIRRDGPSSSLSSSSSSTPSLQTSMSPVDVGGRKRKAEGEVIQLLCIAPGPSLSLLVKQAASLHGGHLLRCSCCALHHCTRLTVAHYAR
jgi:hypothetical protein